MPVAAARQPVPDFALDPATAADEIRSFLASYLDAAPADGYVVGVSGGLDSVLAAHLLADAVGPEHVTALLLPAGPSDPENVADARDVCERLGVDYRETDVQPIVDDVTAAREDLSKTAVGNVQARVRMVMLYQAANDEGRLVVGPNNRSELLLGYFTKYGDGAADVAPLADVYKTEAYALAREVGVSEHVVEKTPTAELWEGQTDPGELGAPYETIDPILHAYVDEDRTVDETVEATGEDRETVASFAERYEASTHKRERPPSPDLR
nr:NAD+ synthase [Halobacterium sp. CBA1126]